MVAFTALGLVVLKRFDLANIAMVYLAGVVISAVWLGRGPSVLAAVLGVAAFDFFFVPPRWTLQVESTDHLIALGTLLAVSLITSGVSSWATSSSACSAPEAMMHV